MMAVHAQTKGDLPQTIIGSLDKVWAYLRTANANAGHNVVVYRHCDPDSGVMDIDVGVLVDAPLAGDGMVVPASTPAGTVVATTHIGPYDKLGEASAALHDYCKQNGHPIVGPTWEEYGDWVNDPSQLRTDVFALVER